jgi:hypothetical protein
VLKAIQPYTRVRIPFIAQQLNVPAADVEQLLISLILDGRIEGRINQVQQVRGWHVGCCGRFGWGGGGGGGWVGMWLASPAGLLACWVGHQCAPER